MKGSPFRRNMRIKISLIIMSVIVSAAAFLGLSGCSFGTDLGCKHEYDYKVTKPATCLEDGSSNGVCKKCGDTTTRTLFALGHKPEPIGQAVEATCEHAGSTAGEICSRCKTVLSEVEEIPVQKHSYGKDMRCKWCNTIKTYTIIFDADNGSETVKQTYEHGQRVVFPAAPQKADYAFCGWYIGEEEYTEGSEVVADVTVRAKWTTRVEIRDGAGLKAIAQHPDYCYVLVNDINMRGGNLPVIGEFSGVLDGQGYTVRDFIIDESISGGVFGLIKVNNGTVKDIVFSEVGFSVQSTGESETNIGVVAGTNNGTVENVTVSDGSYALNVELRRHSVDMNFGLIVGKNGGIMTGCNSSANVNLTLRGTSKHNNNRKTHHFNIGGVAGLNGSTIEGCYYGGTINAESKAEKDENNAYVYNYYNIGGLTGQNSGATALVSESYCNAHIVHKTLLVDGGDEFAQIGGAVGVNTQGALVKETYAVGQISCAAENGNTAGGFVGVNESNAVIQGCYTNADAVADGKKRKTARIGGFAGQNAATIQKSYSTGEVNANNVSNIGGFVGENLSSGTIRYSYCTGSIEAEGNGSAGYFSGSAAGSVYKCYFLSNTLLMVNGEFVLPESAAGNNAPSAKFASELWSETFLSEELNWDTEDGWLVFTDDNPLLSWELKRGHNFESKTVAPTHEYGGYTAYFCDDCGRVVIKDYVEPLGHTYEIVDTVEPTCTEQGYDIVRCTKDGCDLDGEVRINFTEATGHKKGNLISAETAATCGTAGIGTYACADCGQNFTAEISATDNHAWTDVAALSAVECSDADCGAEGYTAHRLCSECGITDGKIIISQHTDADKDNVCDKCKRFTFTTVDRSEFIEISDKDGLAAIRNGLDKNYILTENIYLGEAVWQSIGTKANPFRGILYGNGHIINGLTIEAHSGGGELAAGLFGYNSGTVIDLTVEFLHMDVVNTDTVFGGIAAYNSGKIIDCKLMGDNVLQFTADKTYVNERGGKDSCVYTLSAGGFAGINLAGGVIGGCTVGGRLISRNVTYGKIIANVGNTVWSAAGAVLNSVIFDTSLSVTQTVTFGGVVGRNSGTVSDCSVTGEVNIYSVADAELMQLKGKIFAQTNLYAGSLIGYNAGLTSGNTASAVSFDIPAEYGYIGIPYVITGKSYTVKYEIVNHGADGDGKIGVDIKTGK